jgi:hypothetical protein
MNGIFRNTFMTPHIGELGGHVVSTIILSALFILITLFLINWLDPKSKKDALTIGLLWLLMTVSFEFLAGHFLFGHPWSKLFADYNIAKGRIWTLLLVVTFMAPMLSAKIKKLI